LPNQFFGDAHVFVLGRVGIGVSLKRQNALYLFFSIGIARSIGEGLSAFEYRFALLQKCVGSFNKVL
jgi:hypothetical protein